MEFDWDDNKDRRNRTKHGISLAAAKDFDWVTALRIPDIRKEYGEMRYVALGYIDQRLHVCVYTERTGTFRIISLRKANKKEEAIYEDETIDE